MEQSKILEQKLQDAENSIKYMKEEHQSILKGLHNEIATLQQKCSGTVPFLLNQLLLKNYKLMTNILLFICNSFITFFCRFTI